MPYSSSEIKKLAIPTNHKIKFDGYDYWWYSKIGRSWQLHCIKPFDSRKKALSYIKYWIAEYWNKDEQNEEYFSNMIKGAMEEVRIYDIVNSDIKTIDKVVAILDIKPYLNHQEISEYLGITKVSVGRYFKRHSAKLLKL